LQRTAFRHATSRTDNMQRSAWHHAEKIRFKIPDATDSKIGCNGQHCDMQQAEPTTCNVATCCFNLQHAALLQPAACNMHNKQQEEEGMTRASAAPVGSAKFGPRVGANVGARVGGLVSPTLVGAGVPVGAGVGAAHAPKRVRRACRSPTPTAPNPVSTAECPCLPEP
jgi:hypothetical protein